MPWPGEWYSGPRLVTSMPNPCSSLFHMRAQRANFCSAHTRVDASVGEPSTAPNHAGMHALKQGPTVGASCGIRDIDRVHR